MVVLWGVASGGFCETWTVVLRFFLVLNFFTMDRLRLLFILLVGRLYVCNGVYFIDVPGWWYTPSGSVGYDEECDVYTYALDDFI